MEDTEKIDFDLEVFGANDFKTPFTTKNIDPMVEEIPYAYFKASAFIKNEFCCIICDFLLSSLYIILSSESPDEVQTNSWLPTLNS